MAILKTPKSMLKELEAKYQRVGGKLDEPIFRDTLLTESDPSKRFCCSCTFLKHTGGRVYKGEGTAPTKKIAEQNACQQILDLVELDEKAQHQTHPDKDKCGDEAVIVVDGNVKTVNPPETDKVVETAATNGVTVLPVPKTSTPCPKSMKRKMVVMDKLETMLEVLESKCKPTEKLDEHELFCQAMASKLRRIAMKNVGIAEQAKLDIHLILQNAETKSFE